MLASDRGIPTRRIPTREIPTWHDHLHAVTHLIPRVDITGLTNYLSIPRPKIPPGLFEHISFSGSLHC